MEFSQEMLGICAKIVVACDELETWLRYVTDPYRSEACTSLSQLGREFCDPGRITEVTKADADTKAQWLRAAEDLLTALEGAKEATKEHIDGLVFRLRKFIGP